jgi:hypothetical protein
LADVFGDFHRASTFAKASADMEVGAAHGAEVGGLGAFLREGFVVELTGGFRIEAEVELVFPAKSTAGYRE